jgi:hypothetical protein
MKNQLMSLLQFYLYVVRSLHVSGPPAHPQEISHSCLHTHWFSIRTVLVVCSVCTTYNVQSMRPERYGYWTNGCVNSCVKSPEDGPVGPKHVEIWRHTNKIEIVTSVGFSFHMHTTVSTTSGSCHTVTAICRYHGRVGTGLNVLWVVYSTLKLVPTLPQ